MAGGMYNLAILILGLLIGVMIQVLYNLHKKRIIKG
jgi:hypothetical protein